MLQHAGLNLLPLDIAMKLQESYLEMAVTKF